MISFCRIAGAYFFTEAGLISYGIIIMRCCFVRNFLGGDYYEAVLPFVIEILAFLSGSWCSLLTYIAALWV